MGIKRLLPTLLSGVTLSVGSRSAPLLYVSSSQINFQVPYEVSPGTVDVTVTTPGGTAKTTATVTAVAPAIFTYGNNWAVVQNQDYTLNAAANPARVGSYITLYGTGGGAVAPPVATANAAPVSTTSQTIAKISASINGVAAQVSFAGLTGGAVGLLQVTIQIPAVPSGNYAITLQSAGVTSNSPTIAVTQ